MIETSNIEVESSGEKGRTDVGTITYATKKDIESSQEFLQKIMMGVVIFVVVTFWIELISIDLNYGKDKSTLLQNNQLNKDYFDKVLFLNNEIQNLKTQIEVLKARNPYLK